MVTSLGSLAIADGHLEDSMTHLKAACDFIAANSSHIGPFVFKHAAIMDIKYAVAQFTRPVLDITGRNLRLKSPPRLALVTRQRTDRSLTLFPSDFRDVVADEVMMGLYWNNLAYESSYAKELDPADVLSNYIRPLRLLRGLVMDVFEADALRNHEEPETQPRAALALCLEFFAWMHDPAHVIPYISHSSYMERFARNLRAKLPRLLDLESDSLGQEWQDTGAGLELLLWVLMIGYAMTSIGGTDDDDFSSIQLLSLVHALERVIQRLRITTQLEFEQVLRISPWTDTFCGIWSKTIGTRLGLCPTVEDLSLP